MRMCNVIGGKRIQIMQKTKTKKAFLLIMTVLFWFAQYVYIPYQTPYLLSIGAASSFVGVVAGAYGLTQMILRIPMGVVADIRQQQKSFIVIGLVCAGIASAIRMLFSDPAAFLVANLFSGITSAMWVSAVVFLTSLYKEDKLKKAMGYTFAANNGGILLGFAASGLINDAWGIQMIFAASIISALLGALIMLFVREEAPSERGIKKIL
jgi:MFS family permease